MRLLTGASASVRSAYGPSPLRRGVPLTRNAYPAAPLPHDAPALLDEKGADLRGRLANFRWWAPRRTPFIQRRSDRPDRMLERVESRSAVSGEGRKERRVGYGAMCHLCSIGGRFGVEPDALGPGAGSGLGATSSRWRQLLPQSPFLIDVDGSSGTSNLPDRTQWGERGSAGLPHEARRLRPIERR